MGASTDLGKPFRPRRKRLGLCWDENRFSRYDIVITFNYQCCFTGTVLTLADSPPTATIGRPYTLICKIKYIHDINEVQFKKENSAIVARVVLHAQDGCKVDESITLDIYTFECDIHEGEQYSTVNMKIQKLFWGHFTNWMCTDNFGVGDDGFSLQISKC